VKRALLLMLVSACTNEVDPAWQLNHDRVIAVRMTPPRIATGEVATVDALIGRKDVAPNVVIPDAAAVDSPSGLDSLLVHTSTGWAITAPPNSASMREPPSRSGSRSRSPTPARSRSRSYGSVFTPTTR